MYQMQSRERKLESCMECENNKTTLYEIVQDNIKKLIENLKKKHIKVNEEFWFDRIIRILLEKSTIKQNQLIIHECIKGIFNKRLLEIDNNKEIKHEMGKFIEGIVVGTKEKIWNDRCDQINKIEKYTNNKKDILRKKWEKNKKEKQKKGDKGKNKRTNSEIESEIKLLQMAKKLTIKI
ncbi:hypothetical protein C1645_743436 [Glomus cerebriforme]|uniref:Uncharacterized protein n=1 Tax=Glomus cerebriforme TaxID=658196 RepID=A0A397SDH3_9GLOM|nr:hypothetical protein C1645_743436 [Glomus cerebriforme]